MNKVEKTAKETLIKKDLRVFKTIALIKSTFFELLNQYDFSDITVKMICESAPINRSTFYRYYDSIDDLLNEFQHDTMNRKFVLPFISSAILKVYLCWVRSSKLLPIDDIAELTSSLLINGLSSQFEKIEYVFSR